MIWEPFVLALVLGLLVSAGLYFAYMWPDVELADDGATATTATTATTTPVNPAPEPDPPSPTEPATATAEAEVDAS